MRALHLADIHLGKAVRGKSRLEEFDRILTHAAGIATSEDVDLVILAGDTFDTSRPGPEAIRIFARFVNQVNVPLIVTPGNHDGPTGIMDAMGKTTGWLAEFKIPGVFALPDPHLTRLTTNAGDLIIYSLPYPHKRSMDNLADSSIRDRTEAVSRAVEDMIQVPPEQMRHDFPGLPVVFVGHLSTLNAELSADQAMRLGWDVTVRPEVFDAYDFAFLGHVHRQQRVLQSGSGEKAWYAGAPFWSDFGSISHNPGYLLVELDPDASTDATVTHIPAPALPFRKFEIGPPWDLVWDTDEGFNGYVLAKLLPEHGQSIPKGLKQEIRRSFPDAAGLWIETINPAPVNRPRGSAPVVAASNIELVGQALEAQGLPLQPTLDLAEEIMASVDR